MSTIVLGAGVIGVTTAYFLAERGEDVTVVDRREDAGLETSFANGGLVTPGMSDPWAAPGMPLSLLKWLGDEHAPFLLRLKALPRAMTWGLRFLGNCTEARWRKNAETVLRLAAYSRDRLDDLTADAGIVYDRSEGGNLRLFRDALSMDAAQKGADLLDGYGVPHQVLDRLGCIAAEPALAPIADRITGGILFPEDRTGDAFKFTREIARLCRDKGVGFRFGTTVRGIEASGDSITGVATDRGRLDADRYVLAMGSYSADLVNRLGVRLPICPVKGYSLTVPVGGWNNPPRIPVVDHGHKFGVTPLGDRIRVAGTAELAGFDLSLNPRRGDLLLGGLRDLYPGFTVGEEIGRWAGLRPVTPDGPPILGRSPYRNLFLNCGQGHLGWTMACGSARIVASLMTGHRPEIDLEGMTLDRFQKLPA